MQVTKELAESWGGGSLQVLGTRKFAHAFAVSGDIDAVLELYGDINVVDVVPSEIEGIAIRPVEHGAD